jgi:Zn-dependent metalloprotease
VAEATWIIGEGLFAAGVKGTGLRSMKAPGTAYDDPVLGRDPQPNDMQHYVKTDEDNGGVHINSGIPNRAFYLAAQSLGGFAWQRAGRIWYVALRDRLKRRSTFARAATLTQDTAAQLFGRGSVEEQAVALAWRTVGVAAEQPPPRASA